MELVPLGKTGLAIPPIVFGTSAFGNLYVVLPADVQRQIISEWVSCVDGPIVIDTAGKYGAGLALENIGRQLAALSIPPERAIISNKLGWRRTPLTGPEPTFEPGVWVGLEHDAVQDISYEGILRCHAEGCELLGGYAPRWASVHDPDEYLASAEKAQDKEKRWQDILDAYRALESLKTKGEIDCIGVGAKDWTVIRDLYARQALDWVMIANSFTVHSHPAELIDFIERLHANGVGVINSAVFNAGFLVGGGFYNYRRVEESTPEGKSLFGWRDAFSAVCAEFDVSPATACIQFGKSLPGINAVALSTTKPQRVREQARALSAELPAQFWQSLKQQTLIDPGYAYLP